MTNVGKGTLVCLKGHAQHKSHVYGTVIHLRIWLRQIGDGVPI